MDGNFRFVLLHMQFKTKRYTEVTLRSQVISRTVRSNYSLAIAIVVSSVFPLKTRAGSLPHPPRALPSAWSRGGAGAHAPWEAAA